MVQRKSETLLENMVCSLKKSYADVMTDPNFTGLSYIKYKIVRKRGNRISGKHLFSVYCRHTGIKIIGSIEEFTIKNNHIVKKFYDYLAKHFPNLSIIKRARIFGKLFSSTIIIITWEQCPTHQWYQPRPNSFGYTFESEIMGNYLYVRLENLIKDGQPLEDQLRAKITYLASHAGLFHTETGRTCDVVHYFGIASPRSRQLCKTEEGKKIVKRIYQSYIDCDKCGPGNHLTLCDKNEIPIIGSSER